MDKKLNYEPPMLFTKEEIKLIKSAFGGQDNQLLKLVRKIFLPSLLDPETPVEFGANDMWMDLDFRSIPVEEVKPIVLARQDTIKWITGSLVRTKQLANQPDEETPQERDSRQKKDSVK